MSCEPACEPCSKRQRTGAHSTVEEVLNGLRHHVEGFQDRPLSEKDFRKMVKKLRGAFEGRSLSEEEKQSFMDGANAMLDKVYRNMHVVNSTLCWLEDIGSDSGHTTKDEKYEVASDHSTIYEVLTMAVGELFCLEMTTEEIPQDDLPKDYKDRIKRSKDEETEEKRKEYPDEEFDDWDPEEISEHWPTMMWTVYKVIPWSPFEADSDEEDDESSSDSDDE